MRLLMNTIFCLILCANAFAVEKEVGVWVVLHNCRLVDAPVNDGDSFLIQYGDQSDIFRLYYVDAPETYATYMDRVRDQARYFSISTDTVLNSGQLASQFTQRFLRGSFTVITKWEDARGAGSQRYFALIQKDQDYLSMQLVENGLARIYGMPTLQSWPNGFTPRSYLSRLKHTERMAQRNRTGIWAAASNSTQMAGLDSLNDNIESGPSHHDTSIPTTNQSSSNNGILNVNTASSAELMTLPGIGPALAGRIIAVRPIQNIDALTQIPGISAKTLTGFRSLIIVAEPPPPPKTVDFYLADLQSYLNNDITLIIASIAQSDAVSPNTFRTVQLHTANQGEHGGSITAYIPDEFYDSFIQYYREPGREITGLLHQRDGEIIFVYRRN